MICLSSYTSRVALGLSEQCNAQANAVVQCRLRHSGLFHVTNLPDAKSDEWLGICLADVPCLQSPGLRREAALHHLPRKGGEVPSSIRPRPELFQKQPAGEVCERRWVWSEYGLFRAPRQNLELMGTWRPPGVAVRGSNYRRSDCLVTPCPGSGQLPAETINHLHTKSDVRREKCAAETRLAWGSAGLFWIRSVNQRNLSCPSHCMSDLC